MSTLINLTLSQALVTFLSSKNNLLPVNYISVKTLVKVLEKFCVYSQTNSVGKFNETYNFVSYFFL